MNTNKRMYSLLAVLAAVIMWGMSFLSIKITVAAIPVMTQALLRHMIAFAALVVLIRFIEPNARLDRKDVPMFIAAGLLGITLYFFLENSGMKRISASEASLIIGIVPIFTIIADSIVFKEKITVRKAICVALSFAGVCFIVGFGVLGGADELMGYMLMLGAAASWVVYTLVTKSLFSKYSELAIVYYQTLFGTITLIPFALIEKTNWAAIDMVVSVNLVFLGVFCSAIATYFYVLGMDAVGISTSSLMMNLVPVVAVTASYFILGEKTSWAQIFGGILVILAVYISTADGRHEAVNGQETLCFCDEDKNA